MENLLLRECIQDDADTIIEPILHDSNLVKIDFCDKKNIKLSFKVVEGDVITMHLIGVEEFVCDEVRQGNIVLDLTISSGRNAPMEKLNRLFKKPKYEHEKHAFFLENIKQKIFNKELSILELNPSYGCKLIALVHSIGYE
jgi:hypothetical protein